jgi:glycosyltransferase involved in cell wall biosynthesis
VRALAFGTFPLDPALSGGPRRVAAIREVFQQRRVPYQYVCIHLPQPGLSRQSKNEIALGKTSTIYDDVPYATDVCAGLFAAGDLDTFSRILDMARSFNPSHVILEHPFMLPVFERLAREDSCRGVKLIYSSHNIEAPLKGEILARASVAPELVERIVQHIDALERRAARLSTLALAVSRTDQQRLQEMGARKVLLCRNGGSTTLYTSCPEVNAPRGPDAVPSKYMLFASSDHPPNVDGFKTLLLNDPGLFFLPPEVAIVISGTICNAISGCPEYRRYKRSLDSRMLLMGPISEDFMNRLRNRAHGFILPIAYGGGSNLKTAEAILSGKWLVGTSMAFRGFEDFITEPGVVLEDDSRGMRRAIREVLSNPQIELTDQQIKKRGAVSWDNTLAELREWLVGEVLSHAETSRQYS